MTLELLRDFTHECYALTQDYSSSTLLINHTLNCVTHFCSDISEASSELRNAATRLRHDKF